MSMGILFLSYVNLKITLGEEGRTGHKWDMDKKAACISFNFRMLFVKISQGDLKPIVKKLTKRNLNYYLTDDEFIAVCVSFCSFALCKKVTIKNKNDF